MPTSDLDLSFRAAGLVGHAALLFVLLRKHRARPFPIFTALIGYNIIEAVLLLWSSWTGSPREQYFFYWRLTAVGYVLEVAFIFELALKIMRATGKLVRQSFKPFLVFAAFGVCVAAYLSKRISVGTLDGWDLWDLRATYFATCLTCFLYLSMLLAVNLWHLPWRRHVLILGGGFALWQLASTLMDCAHALSGWLWADKFFDNISKGTYLTLLMCWIVGLWFPERDLDRPISKESEKAILRLVGKSLY